jgi:hypothetical protein
VSSAWLSIEPLLKNEDCVLNYASKQIIMIRRTFIKAASMLPGSAFITANLSTEGAVSAETRQSWLDILLRVATPVLKSLANDTLRRDMPVEAYPGAVDGRREVTYLEALGRTVAGIAPWLELTTGSVEENKLREKYLDLTIRSIHNAVSPTSKDYMNFTRANQPLVDAAFLAHGLLRAPRQLWNNLGSETQKHVLDALRSTRVIKPYYSNWLLFSAMVEAALLKFSKDFDRERIDYAIKEHEQWYKGDGVYGDGPEFHFDYYNSFVIHPMMVDVTRTVSDETSSMSDNLALFIKRSQRYAIIQERLISPEGAFPPVGRSLAYRCGAFQLLAQTALQKLLPESLKASQVRGALGAVIKRTLEAPSTFDSKGWLTIGFCGHQPGIGESYISTGSLYLCTTAFLPLGLPPTDEFWSSPDADWTSRKAFKGEAFAIDGALKG